MIHRAGTELVNWYLLEEGGRVTIVDAGLPRYRPQLEEALGAIGRRVEDVEAIVLTHAHVDHIGFAAQLHAERGVPVHVHEGEIAEATTGRPPANEAPLWPALLRHRMARRFIRHFKRNGSGQHPRLDQLATFADGEVLDVPGRPRVVHTPGHTPGHVVLDVPGEGAAFTGDTLVGWDMMTGREGPILPPRQLNHDTAGARRALDRIEGLDAQTLYYGHGDPWTGGAAAAVAEARRRSA